MIRLIRSKNKLELLIVNCSYSYDPKIVFAAYQRMRANRTSWAGTSHNTSICKKLHGKIFEGYIINARTDIMCSVDLYERENQSSICDDGSSGGGCPLPITSTTEELEYLGATIDFYWLLAKSLRT